MAGNGEHALLFESLAQLVTDLGKAGSLPGRTAQRRLSLLHKIFATYIRRLPQPLLTGTGKHLFRLLFPHEGSRRRYGFKEMTLVKCLQDMLGSGDFSHWDRVDRNGRGLGCLGLEVERAAQARTTRPQLSHVTLAQVDGLLDQLARSSKWSQLEHNPLQAEIMAKEPRRILLDLYHNAGFSPRALAVLTQIILRDLRPLLMPLPRPFNVNSFADPSYNAVVLSLESAMEMWDFQMPYIYKRQCGDLDFACGRVEDMGGGAGQGCFTRSDLTPQLGRNILIPKCAKGRSIASALKMAIGRSPPPQPVLWAETKYDGERMQIHVDIRGSVPSVKIFSKSTRDSTADRINAHSIILSALGIPPPANLPKHASLGRKMASALTGGSKFKSGIILEAELLPYNEATWEGGCGPGIEEFWKLGYEGLKQGRHQEYGTRHLHVAFFDVLYIDGVSLLTTPYVDRRRHLERLVHEIPDFARVAARHRIHATDRETMQQVIFKASGRAREEGLVLKAEFSLYNFGCPWVKLKVCLTSWCPLTFLRDYIPSLGDSVDLVCIGAGWDMDRARDLRVDTSVFTSYYIGVCTNKALISGGGASRHKPHFEVLFRVSWGLDRQQIVDQSLRIHHRDPAWTTRPYERDDPRKARLQGLSYSFSLPDTIPPPSAIFDMPKCVEVMGAGFQKLPKSQHYELRWPRLQKIHNLLERPWFDALDAAEFFSVARTALGYNDNPTPSPNSVDTIWNRSTNFTCQDVVSSPEMSPVRPTVVIKRSPMSPVRTVSLTEIIAPRRSFAASTTLQRIMDRSLNALSSLPLPLSPSKSPPHHNNAPKRRRKRVVTANVSAVVAEQLHARHIARRGGLVLALGTGLRRKSMPAPPSFRA